MNCIHLKRRLLAVIVAAIGFQSMCGAMGCTLSTKVVKKDPPACQALVLPRVTMATKTDGCLLSFNTPNTANKSGCASRSALGDVTYDVVPKGDKPRFRCRKESPPNQCALSEPCADVAKVYLTIAGYSTVYLKNSDL